MLGERTNETLSKDIYAAVKECHGIIDAHDLILNDYGAEKRLGSINVEVDKNLRAETLFLYLHRAQMMVYRKFKTFLVFGFYAIDLESQSSLKLWDTVSNFVKDNPECIGCHGVLLDEDHHEIYCDIVLEFGTKKEEVLEDIKLKLKEKFPEYDSFVTIDYEFA